MELIPENSGLLLAILAAISLGALFKGMTGLGLPLFAVPAMAMLTSVENAVILMIIPGIGANLWVVYSRRQHHPLIGQHYRFLIAGFIGGLIHGRSLQASQYAFIVAFTFMVFSTAQLTGALTNDLISEERLQLSLVALVPTLIFTRIGIGLADKISIETFNKILLVVFFLMEIKLIADVI
jgi:uncharacterized membrane protein YfcA